MIRLSTTLAAAALFLAACTAPYTPTASEQAGVSARVASFNAAFKRGGYDQVIAAVPPKVYAVAAQRQGVSAAKLQKDLVALTRRLTKGIKVESFDMALDRATYGQTTSGRTYALIPTRTVVVSPAGTKVQSTNTTLALQDGGKWYLVRIDDASQKQLLVQAYPEFSNLSVPKGTTKVIG